MKKYIIFLMLLIVSSFSLVQAETFGYGRTEDIPINYSTIPIVNSSDYWDDLDTPADITYDEISGGDVNALGYTGTFNFIKGVGGQLSMDGNPWYLGGTDLELGQNLTVDGNSYLSDTYPRTTLTYSLGSGALRWLKLWVQNISAEYIDTFNLYVNENITVDGFINGINISNLSNTYLPLAGGNMTGDIDMGGNDITNVVDPTLDQDAATKKYVDDNIIPAVTDYWKTTTAQTGLTGDKTGSFDLITTGIIEADTYDGGWITPADDRTKVTVEQVALYGGAIFMPKLRGSATAGLTQTALGLANGVYVYADSGQDPSILLTNAGVTDTLTMKYNLTTHICSYAGPSVLGYTFDNDVEVDGSLIAGDGGTTNYAEIKDDGEINLHGTARVIKKIDIALTKMKKGVGNPPADGLINGFTTLDFDDSTEEEVFFKIQTPDDYDGTTDMEIHIQYAVDTAPATAKNVRWGVEWKAISEGDTFDFTTGTGTIEEDCAVTTGTPANDLIRLDCNLSGGANTIDSKDLLMIRFYRDSTHANDTFIGDARMVEAHVHYKANKLGEAT